MSNLKFCDKCQHGYLAEDGDDCPAEPRGAHDVVPKPRTFLDVVAIDGCKASTEILKAPTDSGG